MRSNGRDLEKLNSFKGRYSFTYTRISLSPDERQLIVTLKDDDYYTTGQWHIYRISLEDYHVTPLPNSEWLSFSPLIDLPLQGRSLLVASFGLMSVAAISIVLRFRLSF